HSAVHPPTRALPSSPTRRSLDLDGQHVVSLQHGPDEILLTDAERPVSEVTMEGGGQIGHGLVADALFSLRRRSLAPSLRSPVFRSEENTSELQSLRHLVCRLLLE